MDFEIKTSKYGHAYNNLSNETAVRHEIADESETSCHVLKHEAWPYAIWPRWTWYLTSWPRDTGLSVIKKATERPNKTLRKG